MADCSNVVTAVIHLPPKDEEHPQESEEVTSAEAKVESHEESDSEESDDEIQVDLDEPSDTENYEPKTKEGEEEDNLDDDDDSCSSGEEEDVDVALIEIGGQKFYKLKYADLEAKKKELEKNFEEDEECKREESKEKAEGESQDDEGKAEGESQEEEEKVEGEFQEDEKSKTAFKEYRTASMIDENMDEDYKSDDDEPYNPVNSDLSDIEYAEDEERDTESETETEILDGTHKKTGQVLICLKMAEQLKIPPVDQAFSPSKLSNVKPSDQPMECS